MQLQIKKEKKKSWHPLFLAMYFSLIISFFIEFRAIQAPHSSLLPRPHTFLFLFLF